jgi:predicted NBD/HSP70 family sugar kinase
MTLSIDNEFTLVGIDGGASKVSIWQIMVRNQHFTLGKNHYEAVYSYQPSFNENFRPVPLENQLTDFEKNIVDPVPEELMQGSAILSAIVEGIEEIWKKRNKLPILVGIGMPGLKTHDKRGISVMKNGPRIPHLLDHLMKRIQRIGIPIIQPITSIGSDADFCGIGEEYAVDGMMKDVNTAYYIGGGTGIADAIKVRGRLLSFDAIQSWMLKTWQLSTPFGLSLDTILSVGGIVEHFNKLSDDEIKVNVKGLNSLNASEILNLAIEGNKAASTVISMAGKWIARLIYERITTLNKGWQKLPFFSLPKSITVSLDHPYHGSVFDRIIIGQRTGELLNFHSEKNILHSQINNVLNQLISESTYLDNEVKTHYLDRLNNDLICISKLRAAPALGAGIQAWKHYIGNDELFKYDDG